MIILPSNALRRGVALFAMSYCLSIAPALAQQTNPADNADTSDIVVTGSRIARPIDFESPSPVVTVTAERLQQSGTTNVTDYLTRYPALVASSKSSDNSGSGAGIGVTGLNLLNLRNLGTSRTLVLVDGRRHVSSLAGDQAVDINTIPKQLIERVEVLTGGASAVYGADAVSGVVNFILKEDYQGLSIHAQSGISRYGDAGQKEVEVVGGFNFHDGRGNVALSYSYSKEDRLQTRDRSRLSGPGAIGFYRNPADPSGADNGVPDYIPQSNIRYFDTNREGGIDTDFDGFPNYLVNGAGVVVPFDSGSFVPNFYQQGGNATLVSDYGNDLLPDIDRHIVNLTAHYDFSPAFTLFAEGKYANTKSFSLGQPTFDYYLFVEPDNPYIPAALQSEIATNGGALLNRDNFDFGQRGEDIKRETIRTVIGARGELASNLKYEVSYVFGQTKITNRFINDIYDDRFYAALDAVDQGQYLNGVRNGNIVCRASLDPNWVPNQPYVTLYSDPPIRQLFSPTTFNPSSCVPLNLFGEGASSQAALNFIRANTVDRTKLTQHVVSGQLTGDFGEKIRLPGGPISFAVGAEYRKESSHFTPDSYAVQGLTFTNAVGATNNSFDVKEIFGELRVPILKDVRFAKALEIGGAVRLSDYSTVGSTTTWKVDGTYAPVRDIAFNVTYSQAVRAPNISELYDTGGDSFEFITDPCDINEQGNGTQYRQQNCATLLSSLGADPATYTDPRSTNILGFQGGNASLREETAKTWTAGVTLTPSFVRGLMIRADWYDIRIKNAINYVTPEEAAQLCVDQASLNNVFCGLIDRTSGGSTAGQITSFRVVPQNVAQFRTAGLDLNISYTIPTEKLGTFNLQLVGNYLDRLEFVGTPGAPVTNERGERFNPSPKYQASFDLIWTRGVATFRYGLSWFDKTLRYSNLDNDNNPDIVAPEYKYIKERWLHDIYGSVRVNGSAEFYLGINNLFDQRPDIGRVDFPVTAVGRFFYAGIKADIDKLF